MPNLEHFLDDLENIGVEPKKVYIPPQLYDDMLATGEESLDENPIDED